VKLISWQLVTVIVVIALCITGLELYALSQGVNGTVLSLTIGGLIGIPSIIMVKKISKKKVE